MNSQIHNALKNVSWYCCSCGLPNFSSALFENSKNTSHSDESTFNRFNIISPNQKHRSHTESSFFNPKTPEKLAAPLLASTPKNSNNRKPNSKLTTLILNFQSLWNKRQELSNLAEDSKADIIIGTETWLIPGDDGHKDSELMLDDYDIFRRDRPTKGGWS